MTVPLDRVLGRIPGAVFEAQYREQGDPWDFAHSPYEQRRYRLTVAMLPRHRYRRAFEPGCSVGELTAHLAPRCDAVLAMECSPTAVGRARQRCADLPNVQILEGEVPAAWPDGTFDLVVLSELGYYFAPAELSCLVARSARALEPGGTLVAVHWRGHSPDHVLGGDEVHTVARDVAAAEELALDAVYGEAKFRADVWSRAA